MRTRIILVALVIVGSPILVAYATAGPSKEPDTLNDTHWLLSRLHRQSVLPDRQVTIHFENGRIHGTDGCNRYGRHLSS